MQNSLKIYKSDLAKITTSWVTLIIILGMIILPPLYAWINIYASWDPYSNTKGIKVAIVNNDTGADLKGMTFDIGSELVTTLKTNTKMGWIFCDNQDDALKLVKNGDVYATIIIPQDFSSRMTTILDPTPIKPSLQYYVNEKENAIAPKMTDAATNTLQKQITESIIDTASKKAFEKFNKLGIDIEENAPDIDKYFDMLVLLNKNFPELDDKLENLSKKANNGLVKIDETSDDVIYIQDMLTEIVDLNENFASSLLNVDSKIKEYSPDAKENLKTAQSLFLNISNNMGSLANDVSINKPDFISKLDTMIDDTNSFQIKLTDLTNDLTEFNTDKKSEIIELNTTLTKNINDLRNLLMSARTTVNDLDDLTRILGQVADITDKISTGLQTLQAISKSTFTPIDNTLSLMQNVFSGIENVLSKTSANLPSYDINTAISDLKTKVSNLKNSLNGTEPYYTQILTVCNNLTNTLNALSSDNSDAVALASLNGSQQTVSAYIGSIHQDLTTKNTNVNTSMDNVNDFLLDITRLCRNLQTILSQTNTDLVININNLISRLDDISQLLDDNTKKLLDPKNIDNDKIQTKSDQILNDTTTLKTKLQKLRDNVNNKDDFENMLYDTQKLTYNLQSSLNTLSVKLDDNIIPKIQQYIKSGSSIIGDVNTILNSTNDDMGLVKDVLKSISENGTVPVGKIDELRKILPKLQKATNTIADKIDIVNKNFQLSDIIRFLKSDGDVEGDFLSSPIGIDKHYIYKMPNYGTGLTPFYTVLALWVGALFIPALLTTRAKNIKFKCTPHEEYVGKYMLFATIASLQGLIAALGNLFILKVSVHNPILFTLLSVSYSLLFSMIVFSLVSTLGNVGKAIAVIFMLLQITGAGGTFPIQVTPPFFQYIHKLLPFTYAIGGMREAIYGVVFDNFVIDMAVLTGYFILFTMLGLIFKKPLNKFLAGFTDQLNSSHLMGH